MHPKNFTLCAKGSLSSQEINRLHGSRRDAVEMLASGEAKKILGSVVPATLTND